MIQGFLWEGEKDLGKLGVKEGSRGWEKKEHEGLGWAGWTKNRGGEYERDILLEEAF